MHILNLGSNGPIHVTLIRVARSTFLMLGVPRE